MKQREIETILRRVEELRPGRDCEREEQLRLLLQRRMLRSKIEGGRVRGRVEELLEEVNEIYRSEVGEDRIEESAKAIRLQLLWNAIEWRRRRRTSGARP